MTYRDLTTIRELRRVVELEKLVWGYEDAEDVVPLPILVVSVKRGGILVGAFDADDRMAGFVYSLAAIREGQPTQWSHMLGVVDGWRDAGVGRRLKLEQRARALARGVDLIEWTFDPMQALNAHFNFQKLGVIAEHYVENVYGTSSSPLHRGAPTDRFVAEWWIRRPHVERRLEPSGPRIVSSEVRLALPVLRIRSDGDSARCDEPELDADAPRLTVEIPTGFSGMLTDDPERARSWRDATRRVFTTYLPRGYRVVDFTLDKERGRGVYLLARRELSDATSGG